MKNFKNLVYTYIHRKEFEYNVKLHVKNEKDSKELLERAKIHDMDKMLMYLFLELYLF